MLFIFSWKIIYLNFFKRPQTESWQKAERLFLEPQPSTCWSGHRPFTLFLSIGLGVTNTFQQVGEFTNVECMNYEDELYLWTDFLKHHNFCVYNHGVCWSAIFLQCLYQVGYQEMVASPWSKEVYLLPTQFSRKISAWFALFLP